MRRRIGCRMGRVGRCSLRKGPERLGMVLGLIVIPWRASCSGFGTCLGRDGRGCRTRFGSSSQWTAGPLQALPLHFCSPIARGCRLRCRVQGCCPCRSRLQERLEWSICPENLVQGERRACISEPWSQLKVSSTIVCITGPLD